MRRFILSWVRVVGETGSSRAIEVLTGRDGLLGEGTGTVGWTRTGNSVTKCNGHEGRVGTG